MTLHKEWQGLFDAAFQQAAADAGLIIPEPVPYTRPLTSTDIALSKLEREIKADMAKRGMPEPDWDE